MPIFCLLLDEKNKLGLNIKWVTHFSPRPPVHVIATGGNDFQVCSTCTYGRVIVSRLACGNDVTPLPAHFEIVEESRSFIFGF